MSTSPEDAIVALLSRWLARHLDNAQLRAAVLEVDRAGLPPDQAEAVDGLLAELDGVAPDARGAVEVAVREALEALALG
jgi:hypothetical protein